MVEEKGVILTTYTHRVHSTPSVFQQNHNDEPVSSSYLDEKVPVPEEDGEVNQPWITYANLC